MQTKTRKKPNFLTFNQNRELANWMEEQCQAGHFDYKSAQIISEMATKHFGYEINASHIQGMKGNLGIDWKSGRLGKKPKTAPKSWSKDLLCVVQFLMDTVSEERRHEVDPEGCLEDLYHRLVD